MSAAATAAGYLYASGRLRGRAGKDQQGEAERAPDKKPAREKQIRVAVYPQEERPEERPEGKPAQPRRQPKIEYRTRRRWSPS